MNDNVYEKLTGLPRKINKDEIEIIPETFDLRTNQNYISEELNEIPKRKARFLEMKEAELRFEDIIKKYESNI